MQLHPQFIRRNGRNEFAILTYEEFSKIEELLQDYQDLFDLRKAKAECGDEPGIPLEEVVKMFADGEGES